MASFKDSPPPQLAQFDIEAQHPNIFIANRIDLNPEQALATFRQQASFLNNPPRTTSQIFDNFRQGQFKNSADKYALDNIQKWRISSAYSPITFI